MAVEQFLRAHCPWCNTWLCDATTGVGAVRAWCDPCSRYVVVRLDVLRAERAARRVVAALG